MLERQIGESCNANVYLQALSSEVGTKSSGDDLAGIDPINLATSSCVTEGNADS